MQQRSDRPSLYYVEGIQVKKRYQCQAPVRLTALDGVLDNCLWFLLPEELFADLMNMQNMKKERDTFVILTKKWKIYVLFVVGIFRGHKCIEIHYLVIRKTVSERKRV